MKASAAKWNHGLSSIYLSDYKKDEHLIISSIYTGTPGLDGSVKHSLELKVSKWRKPVTKKYKSEDRNHKEILTVTLYKLDDSEIMKAKFKHIVYLNGRKELEFSGLTVLRRLN